MAIVKGSFQSLHIPEEEEMLNSTQLSLFLEEENDPPLPGFYHFISGGLDHQPGAYCVMKCSTR